MDGRSLSSGVILGQAVNTASHQIQNALTALRRGGLVAYPTDTVYGLGADAYNEAAVRRVFAVKERPFSMPLPLLVADLAMLESCAARLSPAARLLAERFMPGALTLIVPKGVAIPDIVTAGGPSVGLRIPDHTVPRALTAGLGRPLVGTSANRSGFGSVTGADEVRSQLGTDVDEVVAGFCHGGIESTIVDMTQHPPKVVRRGALAIAAIEAALGLQVTR